MQPSPDVFAANAFVVELFLDDECAHLAGLASLRGVMSSSAATVGAEEGRGASGHTLCACVLAAAPIGDRDPSDASEAAATESALAETAAAAAAAAEEALL